METLSMKQESSTLNWFSLQRKMGLSYKSSLPFLKKKQIYTMKIRNYNRHTTHYIQWQKKWWAGMLGDAMVAEGWQDEQIHSHLRENYQNREERALNMYNC